MTESNPPAQDQTFLSASQSDPIKLVWMQGFPPSQEKTLRVSDGSFFNFPALRYSVVHMQQFLPTVEVSCKLKTPKPLPYDLDSNIDTITFQPTGSSQQSNKTMARFGELIRNKGNWHGEQIFLAAVVAIEKGGSKTAFAKSSHTQLAGWSYRICGGF